MGAKAFARRLLESALTPYGYSVVRSSILHEWQKPADGLPRFNARAPVPEGAQSYLQVDHPRLKELKGRYSAFDRSVTTPLLWSSDHVKPDDLLYFRGDNAYVWQLQGANMDLSGYALCAYYVKSIDRLGLLSKLVEDDYFGNFVFDIGAGRVSRDLLDSIIEIYFLDRHLGLASPAKEFSILDIGAGYGRLAHRTLSALPNVKRYLCTDAVAESTFISEYYLRFRRLDGRAAVIPLDEIEQTLERQPVDLAINIHSFSECRLSAIEWWLALLARHGVKHLMIVPNNLGHGVESLLNQEGEDMRKAAERHGYRQVARDPKYADPVVQKYALNPTSHFLFERS